MDLSCDLNQDFGRGMDGCVNCSCSSPMKSAGFHVKKPWDRWMVIPPNMVFHRSWCVHPCMIPWKIRDDFSHQRSHLRIIIYGARLDGLVVPQFIQLKPVISWSNHGVYLLRSFPIKNRAPICVIHFRWDFPWIFPWHKPTIKWDPPVAMNLRPRHCSQRRWRSSRSAWTKRDQRWLRKGLMVIYLYIYTYIYICIQTYIYICI